MSAFLIIPETHSIEQIDLELGEFLDSVRRHIGALQITVMPLLEGRMAVWADSMGMLRPARGFWRFADSTFRYAGPCVLTGLYNGEPAPLPDAFTVEELTRGVAFHPAEDLVKIVETLAVTVDEDGRMLPVIARQALWRDEVEPREAPDPEEEGDVGWTIYERPDGTFRAIRYRLRLGTSPEMEPIELHTYPNLAAARASLPPGLTRLEPHEQEHPDTVEHWLKPPPSR